MAHRRILKTRWWMAYARNVPLVATNQAYLPPKMIIARMMRSFALPRGAISMRKTAAASLDHRLKTAEEMVALFADLPEALENTVDCPALRVPPDEHKPILPAFAEGDELAELRRQAEELRCDYNKCLPRHPSRLFSTAISNWTLSAKWGFGLFSNRCRLHQMGQSPRYSRRPRSRLRCGSVVAWALTITILTRCASICCSSGS